MEMRRNDMKKMRASLGLLAVIFCLCMAMTTKVEAAQLEGHLSTSAGSAAGEVRVLDVPANSFNIYAMTVKRDMVGIQVNHTYSDLISYNQVGLFDISGKNLLDTFVIKRGETRVAFKNLKKNKIYTYSVRTVQPNFETYTWDPVSSWATRKTFTTATYTGKKIGKAKGFSIKVPKISGIKYYYVYISKKSTSGYKKVKTVKPGKKVNITNYRGKKFKTWQNYYVRVSPVMKNRSCKCFSTTNKTYDFRYSISVSYK